jgi:CRP-like cAMP-binding protein
VNTSLLKEALTSASVFASLDAQALDHLADECHPRSFGKGQQVFLRGDPGDGMYVVARGSVAISMFSPAGGEVVLAILRPPDTFGELSVVDGGPRVATATVRDPSTLVFVPRRVVRDLFERQPGVALSVMTSLAALVRRVDEQAADLVLLELPARVEKLLAASALKASAPVGSGEASLVPVQLQLTQTELARQVGGSRQQVNRILMELEASGAIQREGHRIVAVRPDLLRLD